MVQASLNGLQCVLVTMHPSHTTAAETVSDVNLLMQPDRQIRTQPEGNLVFSYTTPIKAALAKSVKHCPR